jgi:virulence-associated protein VagC
MTKERDLLLGLIEFTGKQWEENERPEDIRLSPEKVDILLKVRALVIDPESDLTLDLLRVQAPTFVDQHRQVLMRDLQEFCPDGTAHS